MSKYETSVFINCPFDDSYRDTFFRAIVFTIADCGFSARCALERSNAAEVRIEKIFRIVSECRLGVHDISLTELDKTHDLPRFNMPLELGIFLGARRFGPGRQKRKSCLILDRERYRYQKFCSDISGQDPVSHNGDPLRAIRCVRNWLKDEQSEASIPGSQRIQKRFGTFRNELPIIADLLQLEPDDLSFNDLLTVITEWLDLNR